MEKYFDKWGHEITRNCIYCDFRHSCNKSNKEIDIVFENENCKDFKVGKCFSCAHFLEGNYDLCDDVFYPSGCKNYKTDRQNKD